MGKLILVTGGARSGKSSFAEGVAKSFGNDILYIATSIPFDEEMILRIKKHREQRPSGWVTLEAYSELDMHLKDKLEDRSAVLLDCMTIMITNIIFDHCQDLGSLRPEDLEMLEGQVNTEVEKFLSICSASPVPFIIVTNEVGMGIVPEYPSGRIFRDIAGRINQVIARMADEVHLCVSGIPVRIK